MANIEYHSSVLDKSWNLVPRRRNRHLSVEFGFWVRKTVDRPIPLAVGRPSYNSEDIYRPLRQGQIRLLLLDPGPSGSPLSGRLEAVHLKKAIMDDGFEALSYTWGDISRTGSIQLGDGALDIGTNAMVALDHLRHASRVRAIWIDAICINQRDDAEKNVQVQLMARIYSGAARVLVWLGPSTEHSAVGMDILRDFASSGHVDDAGAQRRDAARWRRLPPEFVRPGLQDVLKRVWWSRQWVVQEAALAKNILMMCGNHEIQWPNRCVRVVPFMRAIKLALVTPQWKEAELDDIGMESILDLLEMQLDSGPQQHIWSRLPKRHDYLEMVFKMRHRDAVNQRDKIYSLLGLGGEAAATSIIVDYTKSVEEVYDDFARFVAGDTERICAELSSLEAQDHAVEDEKGTVDDVVSPKARDGGTLGLDVFMQNMCDQAVKETKNGQYAKAAKLLGDMALLLRGESYRS